MTNFVQQGNASKPYFEFNNITGIMSIKGVSMPENSEFVYLPALEWLEMYKENPNPNTQFIFNLEYINTASSKMLHEVLKILDYIYSAGGKVEIFWLYDPHDTDIYEIGEEFNDFTKIPFNLIEK